MSQDVKRPQKFSLSQACRNHGKTFEKICWKILNVQKQAGHLKNACICPIDMSKLLSCRANWIGQEILLEIFNYVSNIVSYRGAFY